MGTLEEEEAWKGAEQKRLAFTLQCSIGTLVGNPPHTTAQNAMMPVFVHGSAGDPDLACRSTKIGKVHLHLGPAVLMLGTIDAPLGTIVGQRSKYNIPVKEVTTNTRSPNTCLGLARNTLEEGTKHCVSDYRHKAQLAQVGHHLPLKGTTHELSFY